MATLAHMKNKPVYVLVESYKFIRRIPLDNSSLPKSYLVSMIIYSTNIKSADSLTGMRDSNYGDKQKEKNKNTSLCSYKKIKAEFCFRGVLL